MSVNTSSSQDLNILVQELSKTNPDSKLIRNKTDILGIPYSSDLIILMSEVLVYLSKASGASGRKARLKEKAV